MFSGILVAVVDIHNREIPTPRDFHDEGYNWFGSWFIFIIRILVAFPFYIIGTLIVTVYKFFSWLLTVGDL
jgi:hypothetical protein